jgi:CBS domain-containing protein
MKSIRELVDGRPPISLPASATVIEAVDTMHEAQIGALVVVDEDGGALGVFTERDLMSRVVKPGLDPVETRLEAVMTRDLFTSPPDRRINEVARELQARHIRHLPVVEDGLVIGMLSLRDLLRAHLEVKRNEVEALTAYIQGEEGAAPPEA